MNDKSKQRLKIMEGRCIKRYERYFTGRNSKSQKDGSVYLKVKRYSFIEAVKTINSHKVIYSLSHSSSQKPRDKKLLFPKKNIDNSESFFPMPEAPKKKYEDKFKYPERFYKTTDGIKAVKINLKEIEQDAMFMMFLQRRLLMGEQICVN